MSLKEARQEAGMTQKELAVETGISLRSIQHMERNYRKPEFAQLETLCKMAIALNCPIENLFTDDSLKELYKQAKTL